MQCFLCCSRLSMDIPPLLSCTPFPLLSRVKKRSQCTHNKARYELIKRMKYSILYHLNLTVRCEEKLMEQINSKEICTAAANQIQAIIYKTKTKRMYSKY